jgi:hypothetical protein
MFPRLVEAASGRLAEVLTLHPPAPGATASALERAPKKSSVLCRFALVPFDLYEAVQVQPRKIAMRFISIFTHEPNERPPTEAEMANMGKLIEDGMRTGWLIATEGVSFGTIGVRVHKSAHGECRVTDGPFTEAKEIIGGYALLKAASKEEVVEHTRRFLDAVGQGTCEIYQLYEDSMGESPCATRTSCEASA